MPGSLHVRGKRLTAAALAGASCAFLYLMCHRQVIQAARTKIREAIARRKARS